MSHTKKLRKVFLVVLSHSKCLLVFRCCCYVVLCVGAGTGEIVFSAQNKQYCRLRISVFFTSVEFNVYLASEAGYSKTTSLSLFSATPKSC